MKTAEIVILETSDIHGNVYPINYGTNEAEALGMAKLASIVQEERAQHRNVLLVDNGDLIQGTPFTYHYVKKESDLPNPMILAANRMQYDAAVFGNHEFNYGLASLERAVQESAFPWLSATILDAKTKEPYFGKPYVIKELEHGIRVGILGLTTQYIPHWEKEENIKGLIFQDAVEAAKKWVQVLKEQENVDVVVVSYHGGFERDLDNGEPTELLTGENQGYAICEEVPGIDVLLTGHQHRKIAGTSINGVLIVQPGNNATAIGKVVLELEQHGAGWTCIRKESELIEAADAEPDAFILDQLQTYEDAVQVWLDQPIGRIEGDMTVHDPLEIRMKDNPLIEFINRVQMQAAGSDISNTALFHNGAPGFPEQVTMREVMANYIYPNTLAVIEISGKDMLAALEHSAAYFEHYDGSKVRVSEAFTTPKPQHYNYDMWEGIDYEMNISRPVGKRVVKLEYKGGPVEMDKTYQVVLNNYRAGGGGDYIMYQGKPIMKEIPVDVSELIANHFMEHPVVQAKVDHNWRVVHD